VCGIQARLGLPLGRCCWPRDRGCGIAYSPFRPPGWKRQGLRLPGVMGCISFAGDIGLAACPGACRPGARVRRPCCGPVAAGERSRIAADRLADQLAVDCGAEPAATGALAHVAEHAGPLAESRRLKAEAGRLLVWGSVDRSGAGTISWGWLPTALLARRGDDPGRLRRSGGGGAGALPLGKGREGLVAAWGLGGRAAWLAARRRC